MFQQLFRNMTPVVKNILLINIVFYIAQLALPKVMYGVALYPIASDAFEPWQLATHFFMHSPTSFMHIIFNMFAVVMFGPHLERVWGAKRFLIYYLATAMGAAALHLLVGYISYLNVLDQMTYLEFQSWSQQGYEVWQEGLRINAPANAELVYNTLYTPMLGASGAVFGILVAFGYLFPNTELMLLFPPIPIKAKWLAIGYAALELYLGFANNPSDNVAHFAHLGGALVGIILVLIWQRNKNRFY